MYLRHLRADKLRNLAQAELLEPSRVNILHGDNGSGKTSILEAIHLVGVGKPFRRARFKPLIQHGVPALHVFAQLALNHSSPSISVGIERTRHGTNRTLLNNAPVSSASTLADALPLQIIDSSVFQLLEGASSIRREFMDWGVFHVKPNFREYWSKACRCVKQRNILLRAPNIDQHELGVWSQTLAEYAQIVDEMRQAWFTAFQPFFERTLDMLYPNHSEHALKISYYRGWGDYNLRDKLLSDWGDEQSAGFTRVGPHRADLYFKVGTENASLIFSRGQLKLVASALRLAQAEYLLRTREKNCVILVDDLVAELDRPARERFVNLLKQSTHQVFVSYIDAKDAYPFWGDQDDLSMFHVKHGKIFRNSTLDS